MSNVLPRFRVDALADGDATEIIIVEGVSDARRYRVLGKSSGHYESFFGELARDLGTRHSRQFDAVPPITTEPPWKPLITENLCPRILSGYGDPAAIKTEEGYFLVATSNDAPDAFPILHSDDLERWNPVGFAFEDGNTPLWALSGVETADFWAPEIAKVGAEYWLTYTARHKERGLSIGLARSRTPTGPWVDNGKPLITDNVIDAHIFVEDGVPTLFWKKDSNGHWPKPLAYLLAAHPELIDRMFDLERDRRTASFAAAVRPWANTRRPAERYYLMEPLIRAVLANWTNVRSALAEFGDATEILEAMRTPIFAQRLSDEGDSLTGPRTEVLNNDLGWEGHLVEGPWVTKQEGRYWLFYAGNDYTSPSYGIGVAVSDSRIGPYVKQEVPLLRSTPTWLAPGHASVAPGLDGRPQLFFHAYHPGTGGYNEFRALLTVGLEFGADGVGLRS